MHGHARVARLETVGRSTRDADAVHGAASGHDAHVDDRVSGHRILWRWFARSIATALRGGTRGGRRDGEECSSDLDERAVTHQDLTVVKRG
jgi:hypothetical protein